jgi:O-antigen/teichoic acid export membrane protein
MENSLIRNFINIYIWKIISLLSGFLSLLFVIPSISNNSNLFGIYSFCISLTLYLSYADIGFLGAGQKFAAEEYAKNNIKTEIEIFGFTTFILLIMIFPFSIFMIFLTFNPGVILSNLSLNDFSIVRKLFIIIALLSPIQIILQRLSQSILSIRIKDFITLKIDIFFNVIKIFSTFYFFSNKKYDLVGYFLFINLATILSACIGVYLIKKYENYNFKYLIKNIKYSKYYYNKILKLALSSLLSSLAWLFYYEIDSLIIGKYFGVRQVAIYAIGFSIMNLIRNLSNILFSPFGQRLNHLIGSNLISEVKSLTSNLINYTFPLFLCATTILILSIKYLIISWVGVDYIESIKITELLIFATAFGFIIQPVNFYFNSTENVKYLNTLSLLLPVTFILTFLFLHSFLLLKSVAIAKIVTFFICTITSLYGIRNFFNIINLFKEWVLQIIVIVPLLFYLVPYIFKNQFSFLEKSKLNLFFSILIITLLILISLFSFYMTNHKSRNFILGAKKYTFKN